MLPVHKVCSPNSLLCSECTKLLFEGGRLILMQAPYGVSLVYFMSLPAACWHLEPFRENHKILFLVEQWYWSGFSLDQVWWCLEAQACRGLGIGPLQAMNKALKAKCFGRFAYEEDTLWKNVVKVKYDWQVWLMELEESLWSLEINHWWYGQVQLSCAFRWKMGGWLCSGMMCGGKINLSNINFQISLGLYILNMQPGHNWFLGMVIKTIGI